MAKRAIKVNSAAPTPSAPKGGPLLIDRADLAPIVDRLARAKAELDGLERQIATDRATLDPQVTEIRDLAEKGGHFTKSVQVKGTGQNARYTFRDSYAPIDTCAREDLRSLLGPHYGELFTEDRSVKLRKEKIDALIDLLGDLASEFLDVDPCLSPVDNFREIRADLRGKLTDGQNASLDLVVQQVANKPALSFK